MSNVNPVRIEIFSDTVCPWCYIGKRRLEKALEPERLTPVEVSWQAFQLNPDLDPAGVDRERYLSAKFGGEANAEHIYAQVEAAGREEGLEFRFDRIKRTPNTFNSHRLIHYASDSAQRQDAVVEALFVRYFMDGEDIGDLDVLSACAAQAGLDEAETRRYLEGDEHAHTVRSQDVMARQLGIQGVPFFIIERRYAVSGAQSPEVFGQVFAALAGESADAPVDANHAAD